MFWKIMGIIGIIETSIILMLLWDVIAYKFRCKRKHYERRE